MLQRKCHGENLGPLPAGEECAVIILPVTKVPAIHFFPY